MLLKIIGKPIGDNRVMVGYDDSIKIVDLDTGEDITRNIRKIVINIQPDEIVTANLECLVGELDLSGVEGYIKKSD